ncbi:MAG: glucose-1-phosphate thymidylyltransferase RfbA [Thermodesulfovibrionales bacterium]|nr:glucose-1-phosphate thymidylyltransferase RfbA [Thermodesulfovibrionales bacterium]
MKGIILAGGSGTRLYPATLAACKQLLPIYDKPLIYYPLSTLMLTGIREILIISTPEDTPRFQKLFGDGSQLGVSFAYIVQSEPRGIADAFILGKDFIGHDNVCLILGDNIFFGHGLTEILSKAKKEVEKNGGATIFGYYVKDPQRYGVIEFDKKGKVISIEEKPKTPKSHYAQTGLYFYDNNVTKLVKNIKPSKRGELEITDLNLEYLKIGKLKATLLGRGFAWLDTGTHESMLSAGEFIAIVEKRQGYKIGCIEEIAYRLGYIDKAQLNKLIKPLSKSSYGEYLMSIIEASQGVNHAI